MSTTGSLIEHLYTYPCADYAHDPYGIEYDSQGFAGAHDRHFGS